MMDSVDVEAIRQLPENQALLKSIEDQSQLIKQMKEDGEDNKLIQAQVEKLVELKGQLPLELMSEKDRKKALKRLAAQQREADKKAREEMWKAKANDNKKKNKKKGPAQASEEEKFVNTTPHGEKKDMSVPMANAYNPPQVEAAWDAWWEAKGYYTADPKEVAKVGAEDKFVMVIPPPNVTGSLHIGHALTCSIEDTLTRWHRMCGRHVMWLPGTDHAGIATQAVVEKKLMRESGKTRYDLGREKFLEKVWEWKEANGSRILTQLRRLGASVDHSRTVFTMDDDRTRCVTEAFVRMYEDGLIYRDTRLVNWSHALNTALSDIEVEHEDIKGLTLRNVKGHDPNKKYEFGTLTSFAYKIVDDSTGEPTHEEIVVATTRLETMLGDTAVAINPKDERYTHLHGKHVYHPFRRCSIPIILDEELVDMSFGTGAVKITPAHDPNDFQCGRKHGLPEISILNDNGTINGVCGHPFEGMMRYDARYFIEDELKKLGLFRDKKPHEMQIPVCSRSGDIIEPRLKPQWWVKCEGMAAEAVEKVRSKELKIIPDFHEKTWYRWLENIQDWCISRQLWWGHRIPAYQYKGNWYVGRDEAEAKEKASKDLGIPVSEIGDMQQDPDVLDTWFSSGLFPFSVFGWAKEGEASEQELEAFFPGTLLETGHDILFFWVARMVMQSLQLMKKLPFEYVYLHAMVRDKYGRKMSKSLGNVIDPISVIEGITLEELHQQLYNGNLPEKEIEKAKEGQKLDYPEGIPECGADALRFGLLAYTLQGRDVNLDINVVAAYRRFCNKLWQVTKFMLMNIGDDFQPNPNFLQDVVNKKVENINLRDRWVLSNLARTCDKCNEGMTNYEFASVTTALNSFFLDILCDVYVESVKPIMRRGSKEGAAEADIKAKNAAQNTLWYCLDIALRLMHPICPFVTEELWQRLPGRAAMPGPESIMIAHYPGAEPRIKHKDDPQVQQETDAIRKLVDEQAESYMELVNIIARSMRSVASDFNVSNSKNLHYLVRVVDNDAELDMARQGQSDIKVLGKAAKLTIGDAQSTPPPGCATNLASPHIQTYLELKGLIDTEKEIQKIEKEITKVQEMLDKLTLKRNSENYDKMSDAAKEKLEDNLKNNSTKMESLNEQLQLFRNI